jgi:Ca2+-binding RTX toxin-like protein
MRRFMVDLAGVRAYARAMRGMLRVLVVLGALAAAAPAGASTLQATYYPLSPYGPSGTRVLFTYTAAPGEKNDLTISQSDVLPWPLPHSVGFGELGGLITSLPLPVVDAASGFPPSIGLACVPLLVDVSCLTGASEVGITVKLGDGNDRATGVPAYAVAHPDCGFGPCFSISWEGGGGADNIVGSANPDVVDGGEGNDAIAPNAGPDSVSGGNGDDRIMIGIDGAADRVSCGAGNDTVVRTEVEALDTIDADCEVVGP